MKATLRILSIVFYTNLLFPQRDSIVELPLLGADTSKSQFITKWYCTEKNIFSRDEYPNFMWINWEKNVPVDFKKGTIYKFDTDNNPRTANFHGVKKSFVFSDGTIGTLIDSSNNSLTLQTSRGDYQFYSLEKINIDSLVNNIFSHDQETSWELITHYSNNWEANELFQNQKAVLKFKNSSYSISSKPEINTIYSESYGVHENQIDFSIKGKLNSFEIVFIDKNSLILLGRNVHLYLFKRN